jgi:hypothetical protein
MRSDGVVLVRRSFSLVVIISLLWLVSMALLAPRAADAHSGPRLPHRIANSL